MEPSRAAFLQSQVEMAEEEEEEYAGKRLGLSFLQGNPKNLSWDNKGEVGEWGGTVTVAEAGQQDGKIRR